MVEKILLSSVVLILLIILYLGALSFPVYIGFYMLLCSVLYALYPIEVDQGTDWYDTFIVKLIILLTAPFWFWMAIQ